LRNVFLIFMNIAIKSWPNLPHFHFLPFATWKVNQLLQISPGNRGQDKKGGLNLGPLGHWFMKKSRAWKSHATVTLCKIYVSGVIAYPWRMVHKFSYFYFLIWITGQIWQILQFTPFVLSRFFQISEIKNLVILSLWKSVWIFKNFLKIHLDEIRIFKNNTEKDSFFRALYKRDTPSYLCFFYRKQRPRKSLLRVISVKSRPN